MMTKKDMLKRLKKMRVAIVVHELRPDAGGAGHVFRDFLLENNVLELLFIAHPILALKEGFEKSSRFELYQKGMLIKKGNSFHWSLPEPLLYLKDFLYTVYWCLVHNNKYDIYFGVDNLNTFSGYILKLFKRTGKIIYYVIDYVPQRFPNKIFNAIYHCIEKIAAEKADYTWNLSQKMIEARNKKWRKIFLNQIVVPHGVYYDKIKRVAFEKINEKEIIFMGTLVKTNGVQLLLEAAGEIIKIIPQVRFTIIGSGPYEKVLKKMVKKNSLGESVSFLGFLSNDHQKMQNRIAKAALAVALYTKTPNNLSYFADPSKIKNYLGAGVPVVLTDVPYVAKEIEKAKCGFVIDYKKKELVETTVRYLLDEKKMIRYRKNALKFAKKYDWEMVFFKAFQYVEN